ncbi:MAG: PQQ-binding-like beta-propeller repeat protein [Thermoguttaceae bacterium]
MNHLSVGEQIAVRNCCLILLTILTLIGPYPHSATAGGEPAMPAWDDPPAVQPAAEDWPWWGGSNRDNIAAPGQTPPTHWSKTENVVWQAAVPGLGYGSPCLWGDNIFLPTANERAEVQYLLCYDRRTGRKRWQTEIHSQGFVQINPKNSHASSTPACDGRLVFMPFVIRDAIWLSALDFDGKIVWQKRLGDFRSVHGFAASPLVYRSLVIVAADNLKNSFLVAVHRRSGEVVWRTDRPSYYLGTYASPTVGRVAGRDQLLLHGPMKVFSYDPSTGKELWTCNGPSESASSTMSFAGDLVYSSVGFPKRNMLCIRADGSGDVTGSRIVWSKKNKMAYVPSLLLAEGLLYMVEDAGNTACFEAGTGKEVWTTKLDGQFSSSPVLAGGHVYAVNEAGTCFVFPSGRQFQLVAKNDLGDGVFATPVICGNRVYLRTFHRLYCLGQLKKAVDGHRAGTAQ